MVSDIIEKKNYKNIIENQIYEIIFFLIEENEEFSITANIAAADFNPEIPEGIQKGFPQYTLFTLANYTYESIVLTEEEISFEAGFGSENFGSVVTIPLIGVFQIVIEESILYLNPTATVEKYFIKNDNDNDNDDEKESRSMNAFKMNNKNKNLF